MRRGPGHGSARSGAAEEMLGGGERSLHRFLALLVDKFAPGRQSVGVASLARVLPDMAGDGALGFGVAGARTEQRAGAAARRVGRVVAVAGAVGGRISQR